MLRTMSKTSRARAHVKESFAAATAGLSIREYRRRQTAAGTRHRLTVRGPVPRSVARTAVDLRTAGVPKREVHRALREILAHPPSHKELEAIYRHYGSSYRGGIRGQRDRFFFRVGGPKGRSVIAKSHKAKSGYRRRRRAEVKQLGRADNLNRKFAMGIARSNMREDEAEDLFAEDYTEWVEGRGEGSP